MAKVRDVIAYLIENYPHKDELSNARLTKMVYLADWKHAIDKGVQITDVKWFFDNYGPFTWGVKEAAEEDPQIFIIEDTENMYGERKRLFRMRDSDYDPKLSQDERKALDHVIESTKKLTWADFIRLVYSTFPVMSSDRYTPLDLQLKARQYEQQSEAEKE